MRRLLHKALQSLLREGNYGACCVGCCCRYDLSCVDALEAFAAEGLAVFGGRLPDRAAVKHLQSLMLTSMKTNLGYAGNRALGVYAVLQV